MAAATIDTLDTSLPISPKVVLYANPSLDQEQKKEELTAKEGRFLLTKEAPKAARAQGYLEQLYKYMNEILEITVSLTQTHSDLVQGESTIGSQVLALSEEQVKTASEQLDKIEKALAAAHKSSIFGKIFGAIFGAIIGLVGVITGNPVLALTGLTLILTSSTDASSKLEKALSKLPTVGKVFAYIGIAVGVAIVFAVASGAFAAYAAQAGSTAAGAAVEAGAEAGSEAVAAGAEIAGEEVAVNAENATNESFLSKVYRLGFQKGTLLQGAALSTVIANPFVPLITAILKAAGVKKDKAEEVGSILGSILAGLASIYAAYASTATTSISSAARNFFARLSENPELLGTKVLTGLGYVRSLLQVGSSVAGIVGGVETLKAADAQEQNAKTQSSFVLLSAILATLGSSSKEADQTFHGVLQNFAQINNRWNSFIEPYRVQADTLV